MSYYVIEFGGTHADQNDALQSAHNDLVKTLAADVDENAQGSFGTDAVEGTFTSTVTGEAGGDHLASVKSAFEKGKAAFAAVDSAVDAKFTYVSDEGVTTTQDTE